MATTKLRSSGRSARQQVGDDAVKARTGCTWAEWFVHLDHAGAEELDHQGIVAIVRKEKVGPWWEQMITVAYEQARGMRKVHERPTGFTINASRTFEAPAAKLVAVWTDARRRRQWLGDRTVTVRAMTSGRALRGKLDDGTVLDVRLVAKTGGRCQMSVEHGMLRTAAAAARAKTWWKARLAELGERLKGSATVR